MAEEILLVRDDNKIPWGFRLTGGRDFNSPLTVVRITGQSIAENRGLKVGDIITEINNQKTNNLCHNEAQRFINEGGNLLKFIVLRGSSPSIPPALTPVRGMTPTLPICNFEKKKTTSVVSAESVYSLYEDDSFEFLEQSEDEYSEFHEPTEEEINQMLLENAEVIEEKGKNVIGVNFKRFIPKCEFIKDSAVFHVLQEEQVHKELSEKEQLKRCPNKRFSTFLAPPDRPIPQPKPKTSCKPQTEQQTDQIENHIESNEKENVNSYDHNQQKIEENSQNEKVFNSKENLSNDDDTERSTEQEGANESPDETSDNSKNADHEDVSGCEKQINEDLEEQTVNTPNTEFDIQLNLIKNTLSSLEQLPSLIQSQLAAIQNQIDQLTQLKEKPSVNSSNQDVETDSKYDEDERNLQVAETTSELDENDEPNEDCDENQNEITQQEDDVDFQNTENTPNEYEPDLNEETEPTDLNQVPHDEEQPKRRPACPLTPLPRPVVLPGGRIWRKPKDAYNEEFIAETLISQAEVLVGSTVGVNFRKYEPPKFDLSNSAVYKLIHNIETNEAGLQNRDTIPSLQDYYQSPISARHFYCANLANRRPAIEEEDTKNENQPEISS